MRRWHKGLLIGLITGLLGCGFALTPFGNDLEQHIGLAWLFKVRGAIEPPPEVAVVAINERAIEGLGLAELPRDWPRSIHAQLIDQLSAQEARTIVFDMDFQRPKDPADDLEFARAIARSQQVVLFTRLSGKRQPLLDENGRQTGSVWIEELIPPIEPLAAAARGLAPFPVPKVQVNVFQFWTFKPSVGDTATLPAVALQLRALEVYPLWRRLLIDAGAPGAEQLPPGTEAFSNAMDLRALMTTLRRLFQTDDALGQKVRQTLDSQTLNADQYRLLNALLTLYSGPGNPYLNFYGPPGSIRTLPYNAVINSDPSRDAETDLQLRGKTVFVGFSDLFDPGQPDRFYTVFTTDQGVDLSGVEIAATAFANLLTDRTITPGGWLLTALIVGLWGLVLATGVYLLPALVSIPLALALSVLYVLAAQWVFNTGDYWLPLLTPILLQLPLALFGGLFGHYLLERRRQQRVSKAISYYLPEHIRREFTENEIDPDKLNKVVEGVCLATDMSGFTTIAENMPPKALAEFMNTYFDSLAQVLQQHRVDVTEFHADTIMCAWIDNNPAQSIDNNNTAIRASLAVVDAIHRFNERHKTYLQARVGLARGTFYLGHTGGGGRFGYSILGNCANTAARIESLNTRLGTQILLTQDILDHTTETAQRKLGRFALVGKSEPVAVAEILTGSDTLTNADQIELCRRFGAALDSFQSRHWQQATQLFESLSQDYPLDGPTLFYLAQCQDLQHRPVTNEQDTIVQMKTK